ncbi:MAG: hypothetical protein WDZ31_07590 [Phycisphaeraceae bacterium]
MTACHLQPPDKRALVSDVGQVLVRKHGKRKHYKPEQVRDAALELGYAPDVFCWAYCFFCSEVDFLALHQRLGEVCDYAGMKTELVTDLAGDAAGTWFSVDLSWLDWPDVDFASLFEWFDFSP